MAAGVSARIVLQREIRRNTNVHTNRQSAQLSIFLPLTIETGDIFQNVQHEQRFVLAVAEELRPGEPLRKVWHDS